MDTPEESKDSEKQFMSVSCQSRLEDNHQFFCSCGWDEERDANFLFFNDILLNINWEINNILKSVQIGTMRRRRGSQNCSQTRIAAAPGRVPARSLLAASLKEALGSRRCQCCGDGCAGFLAACSHSSILRRSSTEAEKKERWKCERAEPEGRSLSAPCGGR